MDRYHHAHLFVHGNALQVNVENAAADRLILPVHDHRFGLLTAHLEIKNRVVATGGGEYPRNHFGIKAYRHGIFLGAVNHCRHAAAHAQTPRFIFAARTVRPGLGFNYFYCCTHLYLPSSPASISYANSVLTEVSSCMDWIARPSRPAIDRTFIFGSFFAAPVSGMVL